jgi:hypothetical protein
MVTSFSYKADYDKCSHMRKVLVVKSDSSYIEGIDMNFLKGDRKAQKALRSLNILPNENLSKTDPKFIALNSYMKYYRRYKISNIK